MERPAGLEPGDVPFLGWSRSALEFRRKVAEMAPGGYFRPLIVGDPGVGKRTMADVWRRVAGQTPEERPIIDLDTWDDVIPHDCIAITARRPPPGRPCFRLDTGTWDETGGAATLPADPMQQSLSFALKRGIWAEPVRAGILPADLMQRFAITIFMPPLHGRREIDALTYLDFCTKARFPRHRLYYRRIAADLIHSILFKNDWPANLAGLARSLRNLSYADLRDASQAEPGHQQFQPSDTLRDRRPELGWFDRPGVDFGPNDDNEGDGGIPRSAELVAWACGGDDIPAGWVPDVAVRLYTRLVQVRLAEEVGREGPDASLRPTPPPGGSGGPRTDLTAEAFLRLSEEQFARQFLLPGGAGRADGGPEVVAGLRDHPVLGTDFAALQAGLRIDPVEADLPSYRTIAVNRVGRPRSTGRRTQPVGSPGRDPQAAGEGPEPANRSCREQAIVPDPLSGEADRSSNQFSSDGKHFHILFHAPTGRTERGTFPIKGNFGLAYYQYLIQHSETGFSAIELERGIGKYVDEPIHDPALDQTAWDEYQKELQDIKEDLARAERNHDLASQERLQEKRERIHMQMKETQHKGHDKGLDLTAKKARDRVRNAMKDSLMKLHDEGMDNLRAYLKKTARSCGGCWTYSPTKSSRGWLT